MHILEKDIELFVKAVLRIQKKYTEFQELDLHFQYDVFHNIVSALAEGEGLIFNTSFAEISYIGIKYKLRKELIFDMHIFRKENENPKTSLDEKTRFLLGQYLIRELILLISNNQFYSKLKAFTRPEFSFKTREVVKKSIYGRYNVVGKRNSEEFILIDQDEPTAEIFMRIDNLDSFKNSIEYLDEKVSLNELPVSISLIYIDYDIEGIISPQILIINPDYLVDVTTVAECFKPYGGNAKYYLLNKFSSDKLSKHITIGNIVNRFLDILINNPDTEFNDLLGKLFHFDPIIFTLMSDVEIKSTLDTLRLHFQNIRKVVTEDMKNLYIDVDNCILEPSFYAPLFGLQGRLDVFHKESNSNDAAIIELKSGKLFMPNTYGLNTNHYTQTLLYEILVRSSYDFKVKPINFILYSSIETNAVRFAPTLSIQQKEALSIRNDIIITEELLASGKENNFVQERLKQELFPAANGFILRDLKEMENTFESLDEIEKEYFELFASFISKEQYYSKTGYNYSGQMQGQSSLWLIDNQSKIDNFSILTHMKIVSIDHENENTAVFTKSEFSNELVNFRKGDIVLFYPTDSKKDHFIESRINKSTLIDIQPDKIVVKLRTSIKNKDLDVFNQYWNIEHDFLDSGFSKLYRSLTDFCRLPKEYRQLILTTKAPERSEYISGRNVYDGLTIKQSELVDRIVSSKDYFLLWGPPGTGKTSKILRESVNQLHQNGENILLLAYTNRAVDEICEAIENIKSDMTQNYIRIGSRFSCDSRYHKNLFDNIVAEKKTRVDFKHTIENTKVFVATVSSMMGKEELFLLKKFDTIIVDEASQLLEPMLISILVNAKRFVLIGDHKQLPAVVTQDTQLNDVNSNLLNSIGIRNTSDSLFERLFTRAQENGWDWIYGMLNEQGRMHREIMNFPNLKYYFGQLTTIDGIPRLNKTRNLINNNDIQKILIENRIIFLPSVIEENDLAKINNDEAQKIVKIVKDWIEIYRMNDLELSLDSIGIITTFRAQIAAIKHALKELDINLDLITVDTVERFQGSARDIIIYSMAVNNESRIKQILNPDKDGLDRKLNVVITRAKEHFIWTGNQNIIKTNDLYSSLLEESYMLQDL
jgi:DNA replication ATP-dependent helicase Dna2